MRLFEIDLDTGTVALNKPWIMLIPEFKALLDRDKGSKGDYRGDKKLQATKELTFIYFFMDFTSPITDWEDSERRKEALYYANLEQVDAKVEEAVKKYEELQLKAARSLRTYRALLKSLDAMDKYFEDLDMSAKDKKGELLNDPLTVTGSIKKLDEMHTAVENFRKRAEQQLKEAGTGIRGNASLGDNEEKHINFSESDIMEGSLHAAENTRNTGGTFDSMLHKLQAIDKTKIELTEEELAAAKEDDDD